MRKLLYLLILLVVASPVLLFFMVLQSEPMVREHQPLGSADISRIRKLAGNFRDHQSQQQFILGEQDLNHLLQYGLDRLTLPLETAGQVSLTDGEGAIYLTLHTALPARPYLNLTLPIYVEQNRIKLDTAQIGHLFVPPGLIYAMAKKLQPALAQHDAMAQWQTIEAAISELRMEPQQLVVGFTDNPELNQQLRQQQAALFVGEAVNRSLPVYRQHLNRFYQQSRQQKISLAPVLKSVFALATERSERGLDPAAENSAAILALALNTASPEIINLIGLEPDTGSTQAVLTIEGRYDLAQHFLTAAVLAIHTNGDIANRAALMKELEDIHRTTGFSISDLIADRAGVNFAKAATEHNTASAIQQRLQIDFDESYFFPGQRSLGQSATDSLLSNAEGGDEETLMIDIDQHIGRLIEQLPIYQGLN